MWQKSITLLAFRLASTCSTFRKCSLWLSIVCHVGFSDRGRVTSKPYLID
jgi:hypothetical protein